MAKAKQVAAAKTTPPARVQTGTALVKSELESELAADTGKGFEEAGRDAYAVPFLKLLQDLSPQTKSKMAGYIPGAKPGMIYNTVTQKLYAGGVRVIPCHFAQNFIEWKPDRGGFVAAHPPGTPLVRETVREGSKNILPNGNLLTDTRSHFVLVLDEDEGTRDGALIAMSVTSLKVSRRWMSQMRSAVREVDGRIIQPPMFAWSYLLGREEESNDEGQWFQWTVSDRRPVDDIDLYRAAKQFGLTMKSGTVKVNYEEETVRPRTAGNGVPEDLGDEIDA